MRAPSIPLLAAILLLARAGALPAQQTGPAPLHEGRFTYGMTFRGSPLGEVHTSLQRDSGSWVSTFEHSSTRSRVRFTDSFAPLAYHMDVTGRQGPQGSIDLTWAGGRVKGSQALPDQMGGARTFDQEVPPAALGPGLEVERLLATPLRPGMEVEISSFNAMKGAVASQRYLVGEPVKVTVPAGTYEVFPIREAEDSTRVIYVTTAAPRMLVKRDLQAGASLELVRIGG